jgi:hypothetical protein
VLWIIWSFERFAHLALRPFDKLRTGVWGGTPMKKNYGVCGMHNPEIRAFIREHETMFWWIKPEAKEQISLNLLVEAILNYGDLAAIKRLFELLGIQTVATIFFQQIAGYRPNYPPETINFFTLYFRKYA